MGRQRGFWPPTVCQQCGKPPDLGQTLWPGEQWCCLACLEQTIAGQDTLSKSMSKMIVSRQERNLACALTAQGEPAQTEHHRAEWAQHVAAALYRRGTTRSKELAHAKGEAIPQENHHPLHDTLTVPDLAAVEASFERSRLLLSSGPNVAAMGVDAADTIQAQNSLEKMLAHQLAATHAVIMEQVGQVHSREDGQASAKRLTAIARCLKAYQDGLLTLKRLRQTGNQRITVQYVNVSHGSQAVLGDVMNASSQD